MAEQPNQKQQQQAEELCGASIRALTGLPDLRHRGRSLFLSGKRVNTGAPHSQVSPLDQNFRSHRGIADGIALRLQFSNQQLHQSLAPESALQRLIFDLLEQLRVESLVEDQYRGIKSNLHYRFHQWSLEFYNNGHAETQLGLLIYTVAQISWSRLTGNPTFEETDELIEMTRSIISPVIGSELVGLRKNRSDQKEYARHALSIAQIVDDSLTSEMDRDNRETATAENEKALSRIALEMDFSDEADDSNIAAVVTGSSKVLNEVHQGYQIFTTRYDQEIVAASQVRKAELEEFRDSLDHQIHNQGINVPRLARQISELLATPRRDGWLFGEEEGVIDGRRLTQVVASPAERRLFRKEQYHFRNDCLVSFLIDCSGSMKAHIDYIAMLVDIFSRALDQAEINNEILGFTTANWNGGQAYKDWQAQGKPKNPGRLNERCHLIYKNADTSWRRSRRDIAAMLKTPYFREGLDGEAVQWACGRMRKHGEARKILMVISDGSPMDSATNLTNDEFYLDNHLKQVVEATDGKTGVEIYGIGVGLSLTPYYNHSLSIDLTESLSNTVFRQILHMIAQAQRR